MEFFDVLMNECNRQSKKITNVAIEIGCSRSTPESWRRGNIPSGTILLKLSDYLGCSIDYLLGQTDIRNPNDTDLASDELSLIQAYRAMNSAGRDKVVSYVEDLTFSNRYRHMDESTHTLHKPIYDDERDKEIARLRAALKEKELPQEKSEAHA